jgi:hypothetical protein
MEVLNLVCAHCNAPLKVLGMTQYVTCEVCLSKLELRREGRKIFVDVLEAVQQMPQEDANNLVIQNGSESIENICQIAYKQNHTEDIFLDLKIFLKAILCILSILFGFLLFVGAFLSARDFFGGYLGASLLVLGITSLKYGFKSCQ